jgi:hypothetical protein
VRANANCCAGNVLQFDTCAQDNLGIPRCLGAELDCTANPPPPGSPCASAADCCGLPCTPDPASETGQLICAGGCVNTGGTCTTAADCCSQLPCTIEAGQTSGFCGVPRDCAEVGQTCQVAEDCCNGQPCNNGVCGTIIF